MNLRDYKKTLKKPLLPRTLTFLLTEKQILIGLKKSGFGKGNYVGIGGKVEESKDRKRKNQTLHSIIKHGAQREVLEEIGVSIDPSDLISKGIIRFYFPHVVDEKWNLEAHIFIAKKWQGEPSAQKDERGNIEIEPKWVNLEEIPFDLMWDDAHYWLPAVVQGKKIQGEFLFDEHFKIGDSALITT